MYPKITIGPVTVPGYGLMVFLGVVACFLTGFLLLKFAEKERRAVILKSLGLLAASFVCMYLSARLFDALFHSLQRGELTAAGITWEGGVIGGFTAYVLLAHFFLREKRGQVLRHFSCLIPGVALGHALGRVGCFFGGCCYGKVSFAHGVVFPDGSPADLAIPNNLPGSVPVLPTQLYEAGFELLLFLLMLALYRRMKKDNLSFWLVTYGVFRFALEFFRGDDRGSTGFFLSPSQLMSIVLVVAGVLVFLFERGKIFPRLRSKTAVWREQALLPPPGKTDRVLAQIDALHRLFESGGITEEEYEKKKAELLRRL